MGVDRTADLPPIFGTLYGDNRLDVYPHNFSEKIGYSEVRHLLEEYCASSLGREEMQALEASADKEDIVRALDETREMITIMAGESPLPSLALVDCRDVLRRIRPQGTFIEEEELLDLLRMLETLHSLQRFSRGAYDGRACGGDLRLYLSPPCLAA